MEFKLKSVFFLLSFVFVSSEVDVYRAGIVGNVEDQLSSAYGRYIKEAGQMGVDILLLPSPMTGADDVCVNSYDQMVQKLSKDARNSKVYVFAELLDKVKCDQDYELQRISVLIDREGRVVTSFRKPTNANSNCNSTTNEGSTFETDFGVTFKMVSDEYLVLNNPKDLVDKVKNYIVAGDLKSNEQFYNALEYTQSWAKSANVNVLSETAIIFGKESKKASSSSKVVVVEINKEPKGSSEDQIVSTDLLSNKFHGDLSQYNIVALKMKDSSGGFKETVCHNDFCCEFYVKTEKDQEESHYSVAVFNGVETFGSNLIGMQSCALTACSGLNKRDCVIGSGNPKTNAVFEEIEIRANITEEGTLQYHFSADSETKPVKGITFDSRPVNSFNQVTVKMNETANVLAFGIKSRVFNRDHNVPTVYDSKLVNEYKLNDFIFNENIVEFFDYLWIRIRVLLFIVSIYVLEMM